MPNPGKNRKNDLQARLDRHRRVAELYLRGLSQMEIAERLGCSQPTVSNDLAGLRAEWLASSLRDFNEAKAQELAKLDELEREAWRAWERSCQDAVTQQVKVEQVPLPTKRKDQSAIGPEQERLQVVRRVAEKTSKGQVGDPRFLGQVAWCIEARVRILLNLKLDEAEQRLEALESVLRARSANGNRRLLR